MFKNIITASFLVLFIILHAWLAVAAEQKLLEDIKFDAPSEAEERITFKLNGAYIPKIFAIKGEKPRVVFDFPDTRTARLLNNIINTNGKFIKRIRVGIHNEPNPKTRVVFDLLPDKKVDFKQDFDQLQNTLIITVYHAGTKPESKPDTQDEKNDVLPEKPVRTEKKAPSPTPDPVTTLPVPQAQSAEEPKTPAITPPVPIQAVPKQVDQVQPVPLEPETKQAEQLPAAQEKVEPAQGPAETGKTDLAAGQPVLSSITFDNSTNRGEMVLFKLNKFHSPIVFGVEEGAPRIVCEFKDTTAADDLPKVIKADGKYVHTIRIGREKTPQKVRVVLDLAPSNSYDLQQVFFKDDNLFVIIINTLHNTPATEELEKPLQ